jgi:hypothetical protein
MGIAAVVFILAAAVAILAILWRDEYHQRTRAQIQLHELGQELRTAEDALAEQESQNAMLETEILRLRKQPAQSPKKADENVIRANSPAQVRQLTEAAFGKWPAEETVNADE